MYKIRLPFSIKTPLLACGSDTKGSFVLADKKEAHLFGGYGDLAIIDNFKRYKQDINNAIRRLKINPSIIACDLHPNYFSTNFAKEFSLITNHQLPTTKVQHHKAHVASAVIENGIKGHVLGVAFDGTGYGEDGNIWGGEFFVGRLKDLDRIAHLEYVSLPGGESSIKNPWQTAVSYLYKAFGKRVYSLEIPFLKKIGREDIDIILKMIDKNFNSPSTSSMGRFFDAVSSLLGLVYRCEFEAEGPIKLERIAKDKTGDYYGFKIENKKPSLVVTDDIIKGIVKDIRDKRTDTYISTKFHNTVAMIILKVCRLYSGKVKTVVLSGGVFLNKVLTNKAKMLLEKNGFNVYTQNGRATTDAGIPLGQAALCA